MKKSTLTSVSKSYFFSVILFLRIVVKTHTTSSSVMEVTKNGSNEKQRNIYFYTKFKILNCECPVLCVSICQKQYF